MMRCMLLLVSSVALSASMLTACGGAENAAPPVDVEGQTPATTVTTTQRPAPPDIVIADFGYTAPAPVTPGATVTVVNRDEPSHTVTADDGLFDVRVSGGGGTSTFTAPTAPGSYPIHCKYHANMHGSLTVR